MDFKSIEFRLHAIQRMFERGITVSDVKNIVEKGKIIEDYPDDTPFPSRLLLGYVNNRPLHVVVAVDPATKNAVIITVYEPDPNVWQPGFELRK